jgi:hypothetical protein
VEDEDDESKVEGLEAKLAARLRSSKTLARTRPWTPWDDITAETIEKREKKVQSTSASNFNQSPTLLDFVDIVAPRGTGGRGRGGYGLGDKGQAPRGNGGRGRGGYGLGDTLQAHGGGRGHKLGQVDGFSVQGCNGQAKGRGRGGGNGLPENQVDRRVRGGRTGAAVLRGGAVQRTRQQESDAVWRRGHPSRDIISGL